MFESGAILIHLAEKAGRYLPKDTYRRAKVLEWLMWQMGGIGPMGGQANHFRAYAAEQLPYAVNRFTQEIARLWDLLDWKLDGQDWIANNEYSIADMACWGWITLRELQGQNLDDTPNLKRWFLNMGERPAVQKAYKLRSETAATPGKTSDQSKKILYSQTREQMQEIRREHAHDHRGNGATIYAPSTVATDPELTVVSWRHPGTQRRQSRLVA